MRLAMLRDLYRWLLALTIERMIWQRERVDESLVRRLTACVWVHRGA